MCCVLCDISAQLAIATRCVDLSVLVGEMGNCCCEEADTFNIKEGTRPGEVGAGWLKKQGKSRGNWSKRFFVLTDSKV